MSATKDQQSMEYVSLEDQINEIFILAQDFTEKATKKNQEVRDLKLTNDERVNSLAKLKTLAGHPCIPVRNCAANLLLQNFGDELDFELKMAFMDFDCFEVREAAISSILLKASSLLTKEDFLKVLDKSFDQNNIFAVGRALVKVFPDDMEVFMMIEKKFPGFTFANAFFPESFSR